MAISKSGTTVPTKVKRKQNSSSIGFTSSMVIYMEFLPKLGVYKPTKNEDRVAVRILHKTFESKFGKIINGSTYIREKDMEDFCEHALEEGIEIINYR